MNNIESKKKRIRPFFSQNQDLQTFHEMRRSNLYFKLHCVDSDFAIDGADPYISKISVRVHKTYG